MNPEGGPLRLYFACVGNAGRSILAEALCRKMGGDAVECRSGGSQPAGEISEKALTALAEVGIAVHGLSSKALDNDYVASCDLVVTMGCGEEACPAFSKVDLEDWPLPDPKGRELAFYREVRDEIALRMRKLLRERGVDVAE